MTKSKSASRHGYATTADVLQRTSGRLICLGLLALLPVLTGVSDCDEQASPPPICGLECNPGDVVHCGNICATPVGLGQTCDPKVCTDGNVCAEGLSCMGDDTNGWFCEDGKTLMEECDITGIGVGDDCAVNLFCRENDECPDFPYGFPDQSCFSPVTQEGFHCDSNFAHPVCFPCGPGLACTNVGGEYVCLRDCETDADCACVGGDPVDCNAGKCRECVATGDTCDAYYQCCDGSECSGQTQDGTSYCCKAPDQAIECDDTAECCGDSICASPAPNEPKECLTCGNCGDPCGSSAACCGGAACVNGTCSSCMPNATCNTGEPGECSIGETQCDGGCFDSCKAPDPGVEHCDGDDEDCDGVVDENDPNVEDLGDSCTPADVFVNRLDGNDVGCPSTFNAPANNMCRDGGSGLECVALVCSVCESGSECGSCPTEPCDASNPCMPEAACQSGTCVAVPACSLGPNPCWLPADAGSCP